MIYLYTSNNHFSLTKGEPFKVQSQVINRSVLKNLTAIGMLLISFEKHSKLYFSGLFS